MAFQPPIAIAHSPLLPSFLQQNGSPPILTVLQAHSRLKNVQTLTTGLQPVVHPAFSLRFVRLEDGGLEDGDSGKGKEKWVDWVGQRVGDVSARSDWDEKEGGEDRVWLEAQRCLEATAGVDAAVTVLLIASTADPSPIAALQALHTQAKPFADTKALLIFYLIITTSPADPTLLPSLQRSFGPHTGVLSLPTALPTDTQIAVPPPLPSPPLLRPLIPTTPALPLTTPTTATLVLIDDEKDVNKHVLTPGELPNPLDGGATHGPAENQEESGKTKEVGTIPSSVSQAWHRFLREFVTQSVVPFMERSVLSLHESYTSRRALPTRLLSLTSRRFFGGSASAPVSTSTSPKPSLTNTSTTLVGTPAGDRRLVEWSAMLGDQKEVQAVGDPIRREARGSNVEDVLLLHALYFPPPPPPAAQAVPSLTPLAAACLKPPPSSTAESLLNRGLVLSRADYMLNVRSKTGIAGMSTDRRNEVARWFVLAAGGAEEPLAALLLARAGAWETARRRKGMWYALAGGRMERCGIKRLALLYLRRAYGLFSMSSDAKMGELGELDHRADKWTKEDKRGRDGFPIPGAIPRSLGRLLYTMHETRGAVRVFLDLLGERCDGMDEIGEGEEKEDEVLLEDLRLSRMSLTDPDGTPVNISLAAAQKWIVKAEIRTGRTVIGDSELLVAWEGFSKGMGRTDRGSRTRADVGSDVMIDITVRNPLRCEVLWTNVCLSVRSQDDSELVGIQLSKAEEVRLPPSSESIISIPVSSSHPVHLVVSSLDLKFLDLFPVSLALSSAPRHRLNVTPQQQRDPTYSPPAPLSFDFVDPVPALEVGLSFEGGVRDWGLGELRTGKVVIRNMGTVPVGEVWIVVPKEGQLWLDLSGKGDLSLAPGEGPLKNETLTLPNSLLPAGPIRLSLQDLHASPTIGPGESLTLPALLHAQVEGAQTLSALLAYRCQAESSDPFHLAHASLEYDVLRIVEVTATVRPEKSDDTVYDVLVEVENLRATEQVQVDQVAVLNAAWEAELLEGEAKLFSGMELEVPTSATLRLRKTSAPDDSAQAAVKFLAKTLGNVLTGQEVGKTTPPPINLLSSYISPSETGRSISSSAYIQHFLQSSVRNTVTQILSKQFPLIPTQSYPYIFPLYTPRMAWVTVLYSIPSSGRSGYLVVGGLTLEAGEKLVDAWGTLDAVEAEKAGKKNQVRSMYAETVREKEELTGAVLASGWAKEEDPLVVSVSVDEGPEITHDFGLGKGVPKPASSPCKFHVTYTLRNFSASRTADFTLRLPSAMAAAASTAPSFLPAQYTGALVHTGTVGPMGVCRRKARLSVSRAGRYALTGWRLEVSVGAERFVQVGKEGMVDVVQA